MPKSNLPYITLLLVLVLHACKENVAHKPDIVQKRPLESDGLLHILKADGTKIKTIDLEIAETAYEIETDLKDHIALSADQGVLFLYTRSELRGYYMTDIPFSLDLIFIDSNNRIVSFKENTKSFDTKTFYPSQVPSLSVLKVQGGLAEEWLLDVGDYVEVVRFE